MNLRQQRSVVAKAAIIAMLVFAAAWIGIVTRPTNSLAAFWPANAILLGTFVRWPRYATVWSWASALLAFVVTDLVTGSSVLVALWLSGANLVGVLGGYIVFQLFPRRDRKLAEPRAVLTLVIVCAAASLQAALVGGGASLVIFNRSLIEGIGYWFTSEFVNYVAVLPVLLTMPLPFRSRLLPKLRRAQDFSRERLLSLLPALALVASAVLGVVVGGPGSVAFTVPALLWCALVYSVFATALLGALMCAWTMIAISFGVFHIALAPDAFHSIASLRLGMSLLAICPLVLASALCARAQTIRRLLRDNRIDGLTGALNHTAFMDEFERLAPRRLASGVAQSLLMIDVDHFKRVNDEHGHLTGDRVLTECAKRLATALRAGDVFGRIGGEEFAVLLSGIGVEEAALVAERLREAVQAAPISAGGNATAIVTVSIGVAHAHEYADNYKDDLLTRADAALYRAKALGRNRVEATQHFAVYVH